MKRYVATSRIAAELDRRVIEDLGLPGFTLMERAALAGARLIEQHCPRGKVVALCGRGNNGGDGIAMARMLAAWGRETVIHLHSGPDLSQDAQQNLDIAKRHGIEVVLVPDDGHFEVPGGAGVIIDAVYGIGFRGELDTREKASFACVNSSPVPVLAVDVPSGTMADTGFCDPDSPRAAWTLVPGTLKWAHLVGIAAERCGSTFLADIGLPVAWLKSSEAGVAQVVDREDIRERLRPLDRNMHKGNSGLVQLMAGSPSMPGAATLAASAAFLGGAGRVTVAAESSVLRQVLVHVPECTAPVAGTEPNAVLIGCGRGLDENTLEEVRELVTTSGPPVVLDADALTMLARLGTRIEARTAILTPHPGELARLLGHSSTEQVLADLPSAATEAARKYDAIVVAKTAGAIVATPDERQWFVEPGSAGMATAGTGDVLAGLISGLLPRHGTLSAALVGTWVHAAAGHVAAERGAALSMRATDLLSAIPHVFRLLSE